MRMYQAGLAGGRPAPGQIGVAPEWFYKGCGTVLRAHGEPLEVPAFGLDGGEEAEVAGSYVIDLNGTPRRVGLVLANEFSDHKMEQQGYLHLAPSKLRTCAIGPELIVNGEFDSALGKVRILRQGKRVWSRSFATGEKNMSVSATAPSPDAVSTFAALRSSDGVLTIVVINKQLAAASQTSINQANVP